MQPLLVAALLSSASALTALTPSPTLRPLRSSSSAAIAIERLKTMKSAGGLPNIVAAEKKRSSTPKMSRSRAPSMTVGSRRSVLITGGSAAAAAILTSPLASRADQSMISNEVTIDINNAGTDEFKSLRGLYPTIATKVVQRGPFKTAEDM